MLLKGDVFQDERGSITYNNSFDASVVKRIYTIENGSVNFVRGWQGHQIEQRWFAAMQGSFEISVIAIDNFDNPNPNLAIQKNVLYSNVLTYLHVPSGCITAIRSLEDGSKLLVLADYGLGELKDEVRFSLDYFTQMNK